MGKQFDLIRNFTIIAHIDHGKSTLADRMLEITGNINKVSRKQMLDSMELEQERGITIKLKAVRMFFKKGKNRYQFNLIDTPGHVDFGYEVSRALRAAEGALLLVDATQGVQAQTLANLNKAKEANLTVIPVINKIDLESAQIEEAILQLAELGFREDEVVLISAKTGEGVIDLMQRVVDVIPPPDACVQENKALVFDSYYDEYRGVVALVRVISGTFRKNDSLYFFGTKSAAAAIEIGFLTPDEVYVSALNAGEVGFIATGLKSISKVRVGDTVTISGESINPVPGYKVPIPVVFLSFYPLDASEFLVLREAMEKLGLNDAAFTFRPENIGAIGKGFRCGFLGLLHADIIRERIEREFKVSVITTIPSVRYIVKTTKGDNLEVMSASEYPDPTHVKQVYEPWARLSIYVNSKYMSAVMDLCKARRARFVELDYMDSTSIKIVYDIPIIELIIDFYDKLISVSSGYASIDYEVSDYRPIDVVKMDVLVAGDIIAPLSQLVTRDKLNGEGKRVVNKLKDIIPRQQFKVSIQAAVNGKIVAREDISPARKDVTGHLYGGDVTRKKKLLEKQKKGKKRMKRFGKVDIPQNVFWEVMKR